MLADALSLLRQLHFRLALLAFDLPPALAQHHTNVQHFRLRRLRVAFRRLTSGGVRRRTSGTRLTTSGTVFERELRPRGLVWQRSERGCLFAARWRVFLRATAAGFVAIVLLFERERQILLLIAVTCADNIIAAFLPLQLRKAGFPYFFILLLLLSGWSQLCSVRVANAQRIGPVHRLTAAVYIERRLRGGRGRLGF